MELFQLIDYEYVAKSQFLETQVDLKLNLFHFEPYGYTKDIENNSEPYVLTLLEQIYMIEM